jgi:uncharacterized protein YbjT (DUF2867 family)
MATTVAITGNRYLPITVPVTSLTAVTTGTGDVADFQAGMANASAVVLVTGTVTSGTVALDVSHDGVVWVQAAISGTLGTGVNALVANAANQVVRYARARVGTNIGGGGSVTVTLMGA